MTAIASKPIPAPRPQQETLEEQHFVLANVSWDSYLAIGAALADRPGLRISYDRGNVEFMTTSRKHEFFKKWWGRMIEIMAEELGRPIAPGGNMTFQRADLHRGLEGDECFWIEHELQMRRKLTWDPEIDPPPDLVLEIEISRSLLDRLAILAALKVVEVWAFDGTRVRIHRLRADGTYQVRAQSEIFPEVPLAEVVRFLDPKGTTDYLTAMRDFQKWLRRRLGRTSRSRPRKSN